MIPIKEGSAMQEQNKSVCNLYKLNMILKLTTNYKNIDKNGRQSDTWQHEAGKCNLSLLIAPTLIRFICCLVIFVIKLIASWLDKVTNLNTSEYLPAF